MWVIKLDAAGKNILWQAVLGSPAIELVNTIVQDTDGGYLVGGDTWGKIGTLTNRGADDMWFCKVLL